MSDEEATNIGKLEQTPLGSIWLAVGRRGLVAVSLWDDSSRFEADVRRLTGREPVWEPEQVTDVANQLAEYFAGTRQVFDLPIDWSIMTPFQQRALREVYEIPYGQLTTYGTIAEKLGSAKSVRAVGRANATNPIPIIIPCHRVLGADGKLHGYGAPGGLETKAWLLRLEGSWLI